MIRSLAVRFLMFGVLVFCMAICPLATAAVQASQQPANHCHQEKPDDSGKPDDNSPRCCGQQGVVKPDTDAQDSLRSWSLPELFFVFPSKTEDGVFVAVEFKPQKTGERLASLSVLRI